MRLFFGEWSVRDFSRVFQRIVDGPAGACRIIEPYLAVDCGVSFETIPFRVPLEEAARPSGRVAEKIGVKAHGRLCRRVQLNGDALIGDGFAFSTNGPGYERAMVDLIHAGRKRWENSKDSEA